MIPVKQSTLFVAALLLITGCLGGCSDTNRSSDQTGETQVVIEPQVLEAAATFLGAATGKEVAIGVEQVVFVNSVMGFNQVERQPSCMYGDLWVIIRDENGAPIRDENGCKQPIAAEPIPILDEFGQPTGEFRDTVPMVVEEYMQDESKCSVVLGYEDYVQEVVLERLNMIRSNMQNPDMLAMAFEEAMKNLNAAEQIEQDPAGRLVLIGSEEAVDPLTQEVVLVTTRKTIDSPRENLALYYVLLKEGRLAGYGVERVSAEGEVIPAPWLELRPDLDLGVLVFLRDGTPGRSGGVGLIGNYADLSAAFHSTPLEYGGRMVDYVQYHEADSLGCLYSDASSDAWPRVYANDPFAGSNVAAFAKHADDTRKMILFIHRVIQDAPDDGTLPDLPAHEIVASPSHDRIPDIDEAPLRHLQLETAAAFLAGASGKEIPLSADSIMFVNSALGINETDTSFLGDFFGDLWILKRDANGVPDLDLNGCVMPLPENPIEVLIDGLPAVLETVPMMLEEYMDGQYKCVVVPGFEDYVQEVEIGRLNCVRTALTNPNVLNKHLVEAVTTINSSVAPLKRDLAGRLIYTVEYLDEFGVLQTREKTIDSPLQNLALYRALMTWGTLEGTVEVKVEGVKTIVELELRDDLVWENGLDYLKYGNETVNGPLPQPLLPIMPSGFADFAEFYHASDADYSGLMVDYVQWHDPLEAGFACSYSNETDDLHLRFLNGDTTLSAQLAAFLAHAEDAREVILFTHRVIQDRPE